VKPNYPAPDEVASITITASLNGRTLTATLATAPRRPRTKVNGVHWLQRLGFGTHARAALSFSAEFATPATNTLSNVRRISLYTPELQPLAETTSTSSTTPPLAYEDVWFAGEPVAQIESATNTRHYYFNDHLGTPILTTSAAATVDWRVEREPYGSRFNVRVARYQPLAFPGQEEEDASTDRSYNIFRWYRSGWGRYTQADPLGLNGGMNLVQRVYSRLYRDLRPATRKADRISRSR